LIVFHQLVDNGYGKSAVRLLKVSRRGDRHDVQDLRINVRLDGEFEAAYVVGDNTMVLPTDTMKNTVYAFAKEHGSGEIENFALALTERFLESHKAVHRARIEVAEAPWRRISVGEKPHGQAFARESDERRTVVVTRTRSEATVVAGIRDLAVLKTGHSAFGGFLRDEYTTLPDTRDRLVGTVIEASWRYGRLDVPYGTLWHSVRGHLLEAFAQHESLSVQHTLYAMADAVLENQADVVEVQLALPNKHHWLVDLTPFGLENPNEIFVPTEEPFGLIEATIRRRAVD
jgi:urate oxidase